VEFWVTRDLVTGRTRFIRFVIVPAGADLSPLSDEDLQGICLSLAWGLRAIRRMEAQATVH